MTDNEALARYRFHQAEETLADAEIMLRNNLSPRSVVNRAYYSMFYAVLGLLTAKGIPIGTSKHSGILTLFDREFIRQGKVEREYSRMIHEAFDDRLEGDYREMAVLTGAEASEHVHNARGFLEALKKVD
jgi:uncharacterized protein (UPF0332 family)